MSQYRVCSTQYPGPSRRREKRYHMSRCRVNTDIVSVKSPDGGFIQCVPYGLPVLNGPGSSLKIRLQSSSRRSHRDESLFLATAGGLPVSHHLITSMLGPPISLIDTNGCTSSSVGRDVRFWKHWQLEGLDFEATSTAVKVGNACDHRRFPPILHHDH
jgi:hypothetical protein